MSESAAKKAVDTTSRLTSSEFVQYGGLDGFELVCFTPFGIVFAEREKGRWPIPGYTTLSFVFAGTLYKREMPGIYSERYMRVLANRFSAEIMRGHL